MLQKEVLDRILEIWGRDSQIDMAVEEMGELIHALIKYKRACKDGTVQKIIDANDKVCEEIADVTLMIELLRSTLFSLNKIEEWEKVKIERIKGILNS
jgi:hypothetical protein